MGGRKSYSANKVTGRGLGKNKKSLENAIDKQSTLDIAINTAKIAVENNKQKKEFKDSVKVLDKYIKDKNERKSDSFSKLFSEYDTSTKPITSEEKKYLSYAKSRKRGHKK